MKQEIKQDGCNKVRFESLIIYLATKAYRKRFFEL